MTLGNQIKRLRQSKKLKQKSFASYLDISQGYLSKVERDITMPSVEMLMGIRALWRKDINLILDNHMIYTEDS